MAQSTRCITSKFEYYSLQTALPVKALLEIYNYVDFNLTTRLGRTETTLR